MKSCAASVDNVPRLYCKRCHKQDILCIGTLNVRALANWRDVEDRKRMSAAFQRPIDKVPLLAAVEMIERGVEICCLSEVRRGNEEFDRKGFKFFCSGYSDNRKIHGVGIAVDVTFEEMECHRFNN
jgi:hypothetical protein